MLLRKKHFQVTFLLTSILCLSATAFQANAQTLTLADSISKYNSPVYDSAAQDSSTYDESYEESYDEEVYLMEEKKFDKEEWKKITKGVSFSDEEPKEETKKPKEQPQKQNITLPVFNGGIIKVIFFALILVVLAFILFKLFGGKASLKNAALKTDSKIYSEDPEDDIKESDLEAHLRLALNNKAYRQAIRIYYLMVLKELSLCELIDWKKDKTNSEYIRELNQKPYFNEFRIITIAFERVWYGDIDIQEAEYNALSPRFKKLVDSIKTKSAA